jgi:hypothetical protein
MNVFGIKDIETVRNIHAVINIFTIGGDEDGIEHVGAVAKNHNRIEHIFTDITYRYRHIRIFCSIHGVGISYIFVVAVIQQSHLWTSGKKFLKLLKKWFTAIDIYSWKPISELLLILLSFVDRPTSVRFWESTDDAIIFIKVYIESTHNFFEKITETSLLPFFLHFKFSLVNVGHGEWLSVNFPLIIFIYLYMSTLR